MRRLAPYLLLVLVACSPERVVGDPVAATVGPSVVPITTTTELVGPESATIAFPIVSVLARPRVADPDPARPKYIRDEWDRRGWADADKDGCNTRAEVLQSESAVETTSKATNCTVLTGSWTDRYTGKGFTDAAAVEIDHLVALGDASLDKSMVSRMSRSGGPW